MEEIKKFKNFTHENIHLYLFTYLVIGLSFGAKIIYYNYSIDTEEFLIIAPRNGFIQWAQIGRYGLFFLKKYIFGYDLNILFINILTYLLLGMMTLFICYILFSIYGGKKRGLWIIPLTFSSSAILLEQYNFILQSLEVIISNLSVCIAIYFIYLYSHNKKISLIFLSIILGIFSFSIYPSNYIFFISLTIIIIISLVNNSPKNLSFKNFLILVFPYAFVFMITFLLNNFFYTLSMKLLNVGKINYINSAMPWGKTTTNIILKNMAANLKLVYSGDQTIFINKITFLFFTIAFIITVFIKKNKFWLLVLLCFLFLSINSSFIILGGLGPIRALVPYFPLSFAFICFFAYMNIKKRYIRYLMAIGIFFIGLWQINLTSSFSRQEARIFQAELQYSKELLTEINNLGVKNLKSYKLAVYGSKKFPSKDSIIQGDVLGNGFFNWDSTSPIGSTSRIANFFENNGYPSQRITREEYQKVLPKLKELPIFPKEDSIVIEENIILIRIS